MLSTGRAFSFLLLALILPATPLAGQIASYKRTFLAKEWRQVDPTVDDEEGDRLLNPMVIVAYPNLALVIDWGDRRLKAVTRTGELLWTFGRRGAGPGELGAPGMAVIAADRLVWLTDRGNSRVYGLDSLGQLRRTVQLAVVPERAFPRTDGLLFVQPAIAARPLLVDSLGQIRGHFPLAAPAEDADPFIRVDLRALPLLGARVAALYSWASLLVLYDSLTGFQTISGPDGVSFPPMKRVPVGRGVSRLDPATDRPRIGLSLASDGRRLYALTGMPARGPDDDLSDLIDIYDTSPLTYLGSWRLPRRVYDIACANGELIALFRSPAPGIIRWQLN